MKPDTLLFEIAWEVCNQIGGIFTYIKSKVPTMLDTYGDNYMAIGPYFPEKAKLDFRPVREIENIPLAEAVQYVRSLGYEIHYGYWLLEEARPKVLLISPVVGLEHLNDAKAKLWQNHAVSTIEHDPLIDQVIAFGEITRIFLTTFIDNLEICQDVIAHYHEWMSAGSIPGLMHEKVRLATVFTAHATLLGRYLSPNEEHYCLQSRTYNWQQKSRQYGIESRVALERAAVRSAHTLVANSEITSRECEAFFERTPDNVIRSGIHRKPGVGHEVFEQHLAHRSKIDAFVKALFSPSYQVKTEKTLYFFTSGRYEYRNKGFNITLESIARLNQELIRRKSELTVVFFIISKKPFHNIRPDVLESRQRFQDLQKICKSISAKIGPRMYSNVTSTGGHKLPDLNELIDDDLQMTWRQALANFKREGLPPVVTHHLDSADEVTDFCERNGLNNDAHNRVKVIYHPDFIERATSLFSLDYLEFVRGCHLGIFPSLYEPWGYAPMETIMHGTPVITSDLSGFGRYMRTIIPSDADHEVKILNRRHQTEEQAIAQLTQTMCDFAEAFEKDQYVPRASLPKQVMDTFCWSELQQRYHENYKLALMRYQPVADLY
ncbi:MAG: glycogen synthase [Dyadobacter sp.]|uniref:glycogen synthase n=1 Tax=Dyadobacter sp. TaxID=1914288 RepID=UPI00326310D7